MWSDFNYFGLSFTFTYSQIAAYNNAYPNGPSTCNPARGDWIYLPNRAMPNNITGTKLIGGGTTHNAVGNQYNMTTWNQIIWLWVDFTHDLNQITYVNGVPNYIVLYSGTIKYAYQDRWDIRDGRQMGLYKLDTIGISSPPAGVGGSYWYDFVNGGWNSGTAPWLP